MEIGIKKEVEIGAKTLHVFAKIGDRGSYTLLDQENKEIHSEEGYVPAFMPGEHYGDYLDLKIDIDSGQIINWRSGFKDELMLWVEGDDD